MADVTPIQIHLEFDWEKLTAAIREAMTVSVPARILPGAVVTEENAQAALEQMYGPLPKITAEQYAEGAKIQREQRSLGQAVPADWQHSNDRARVHHIDGGEPIAVDGVDPFEQYGRGHKNPNSGLFEWYDLPDDMQPIPAPSPDGWSRDLSMAQLHAVALRALLAKHPDSRKILQCGIDVAQAVGDRWPDNSVGAEHDSEVYRKGWEAGQAASTDALSAAKATIDAQQKKRDEMLQAVREWKSEVAAIPSDGDWTTLGTKIGRILATSENPWPLTAAPDDED